jgi:hypothetical protein
VLSDDPSMAIAVQAADCVPLLIADARLGVVAAAHAGWRGLALGVPRTTVIELGRAFGSRPDDLVAAIGPSVGACCYEVGPEVRDAFARNGFSVEAIDGWFASSPRQLAGNPPMPGLRTEPKPGHAFFDGWSCAVDQLRAAGLHASQVFTSRLCTASHAGVLCSYRREGAVAGRIAGVIRSRRRS